MRQTLLLFLPFLLTISLSAQTELVTNGRFEANTDNWTIQVQGAGELYPFLNAGANLFTNIRPTAINPQGENLFVVTDQSGAAHEVIYQDFVVPVVVDSVKISYDYFCNNWHVSTEILPTLDHTVAPSNQHYRIDILNAGADLFSTNPADIVKSIAIGGDLASENISNPWSTVSQDLSADLVGGQTYRLRFAVVHNRADFSLGIDNVSVLAFMPPASEIPTMGQWSLLIFCLILVNLCMVSLYNLQLLHS